MRKTEIKMIKDNSGKKIRCSPLSRAYLTEQENDLTIRVNDSLYFERDLRDFFHF